MKKLIISNSVLLLLVITVFIFGYYFIQYPEDFRLSWQLRQAEWRPFLFILIAISVAAMLLSFLPIIKLRFKKKVFIFLAAFQLLFLSFMFFRMVDAYIKNKKEFEILLSKYKKKAESDIKSGRIEIEYAGGLELPLEKDRKMNEEIDSVGRVYGLTYRNSGCIISASLIKSQEEYVRYTKPYLDKRNGAGWEVRMKKQIEQIQNKYR